MYTEKCLEECLPIWVVEFLMIFFCFLMTCYLHNVYTFLLNLRKLQLHFKCFFNFKGHTCWHSIPSVTTDTQKSQTVVLSEHAYLPTSPGVYCLPSQCLFQISAQYTSSGKPAWISLARSNALIITLSRHNLTYICMNISFFSLQNVDFVCPLQHSRTHTEPGTDKGGNDLLRSRIQLPP